MKIRLALVLLLLTTVAQAQTLRIGLAEDPDVLDPTLARTFVGRIVFAGLCDKLFDLDEKLNIVPMLATSYSWSADNKALTLKLRPGDGPRWRRWCAAAPRARAAESGCPSPRRPR